METVSLRDKPDFRLAGCALLVIDMQNDFIRGAFVQKDQAGMEKMAATIPPIVKAVAAAQSAGVPVIFTQTHYQPDWIDAGRLSLSRELRANARSSWGAAIVDELQPALQGPKTYVVEKQRYNAFEQTNLEWLLRCLKADTLALTGVVANICVETTARTARDRDFHPILLKDCTAAFDDRLYEAACLNIQRYFGSVATSQAWSEVCQVPVS